MTIVFMATRHFHSVTERRRIPDCYFKTRHRSSYGYYFQVNKLPRFLEARATSFFLLTALSTNNAIPINRSQPASIPNIVLCRPWLSFYILESCEELHRSFLFGMIIRVLVRLKKFSASSLTNKVYLFSIS